EKKRGWSAGAYIVGREVNAINNAWRDLKLLTRARDVGGAGGKLRHAVELPNCRTAGRLSFHIYALSRHVSKLPDRKQSARAFLPSRAVQLCRI
ncbi:hypothetical protein LW967_17425, partial [Erwinia amylovora]|uniref:hypothetical protein n=1 Tax=Erwinia amylovora TaxID=552 RepID=UPI0020BDAD48